jgi:hypothetical protein
MDTVILLSVLWGLVSLLAAVVLVFEHIIERQRPQMSDRHY